MDTYDAPPPPRRSTWRFKLLLAFVLVVAGVWTAGWFVAAGYLEREVDSALASFAADGTRVTCTDRTVGGYPFRLEVRCPGGADVETVSTVGSVKGVTAVALVYDPTEVIVEAKGPLEIAPAVLTADWSLAHGSAEFTRAGTIEEMRVEVENLRIDPATGAAAALSGLVSGIGGDLAATADLAGLYVRRHPEIGNALDVGLRVSALRAGGLKQPVEITGRLAVRDVAGALGPGAADALDRIGREGVAVTVDTLVVGMGDGRLAISGDVLVRPDGLLDGRLDVAVSADGARVPILDAMVPGLSEDLSTAVAAILSFAGDSEVEGMPAKTVDLTIREGRVFAGALTFLPLASIPPIDLSGR